MPNQPQSPVVTGIQITKIGSVFVFEFDYDPPSFHLRRTDVPNQVAQLEKIWSKETLAQIAGMPNEFTLFLAVFETLVEYLQAAYPFGKIKLRLIRAMNKDRSFNSVAVELINDDLVGTCFDSNETIVTSLRSFDFEVISA